VCGVVLNFNHLYYFHVTAEEGSVKAAADRLGITQPTVSEQIRALERALGVQLFERAGGNIRLTPAGRSAFEHTSQMFLAGQRLVESLGKTEDNQTSLRVGVSAAVSRTMAADFLMPLLSIETCRPIIRSGDFAQLLRDLRARELDLLIGETVTPDLGASLETALIATTTLVGIAAVKPTEDWSNLAILEYAPSSAYHWEVDEFLRERNLRPTSAGEVDDAFLMLEAVAQGQFVAFVPRNVARDAINSRRVHQLATIKSKQASVHAIYPADGSLKLTRTAVQRLIDAARETLDEND
jgi:LysR family transcriptional regulator, transcriptional activator of nhaA